MNGSMNIGLDVLGGDIVQGPDRVSASPYDGLSPPVIASAWVKHLELEDAEDLDLERFIGAYRQESQTPEPGAACTGAEGEPA